jgi:hypothetical protein
MLDRPSDRPPDNPRSSHDETDIRKRIAEFREKWWTIGIIREEKTWDNCGKKCIGKKSFFSYFRNQGENSFFLMFLDTSMHWYE